MVDAWAFTGAAPLGAGPPALVTLVDGSTFCISTSTGDVVNGAAMGLFVQDARLLSRWELVVEEAVLDGLTVNEQDLLGATFVTRARPRPGHPESTVLVSRERQVGDGMVEVVRVRNLGREAAGLSIALRVDTDVADVFEVKEGRLPRDSAVVREVVDDALVMRREWEGHRRGVRVRARAAEGTRTRVTTGGLAWSVALPPRAEWSCELTVEALLDDAAMRDVEDMDRLTGAVAARRAWRGGAPVVTTPDAGLAHTLACSLEDLAALRLGDGAEDRTVVAAGVPWFMALFGRDSLLSAWMVLPLDLRLALGTLQTLADLQGTQEDAFTEEQPGRILHERRRGPASSLPTGGSGVYYGSIDSTPLFVMLLGELRRWGQAAADVDALLPAADRALDWITTYGDRDGDGFVEYQRATDRGLRNQGWKDSWDAVAFADGRLAEPPIALAEVQGYAYAAYLARGHFAREAGDEELAQSWARRAADLKEAFNEAFWLPNRGYYAMALDRDKRPVDALASNMGHCLWTGIVDEARAEAVAGALMSPALFSGWGVRTLASTMAAYNPMSYHNGSVWPHDNAIITAGLMRYGFADEAERIAHGVLDAAAVLGGRLPELFCGFDRGEFPRPVPYPTACSPQAWSAAAPLLLLRSLLRFDPWVPFGEVRLAPVLPQEYLPLRMSNVFLAGRRVDLEVTREGFTVEGLSRDVALIPEPRHAGTALRPS